MRTSIKRTSIAMLIISVLLIAMLGVMCLSEVNTSVAYAAEETEESTTTEADNETTLKTHKIWGAVAVVALVAVAGAIGMAVAIVKAIDGTTKQPEAESKIRTSLMLGLVFIETAIIYALIVAILVIFVM